MGKLCKILLVSAMLLVGGCSSKESEKKEPVSDNTEKTTLKITIQDEVNKKELFNGNVSVEGKVETLADFLEKAKDLDVKMEDGQYGNMKKPYPWSSVKAVLDTAFHVLFYLKNTCRIWKIL